MTIYKLIVDRSDSNRTESFYVEHHTWPTHEQAVEHLKNRLGEFESYYNLNLFYITKVSAKPL